MKFRAFFFLILAITAVGCASRGKTQTAVATASKPSTSVSEQSLVPLKQDVSNDAAKAARAAIQDKSVSADNLAQFMTAAQAEYNQGHHEAAAAIFQKAAQDGPKNEQTLRAQYMVGECHASDKQFLASLSAFQKVLDRSSSSLYGKQARQRMEFLIKYSLDASTLTQFAANYPDSPLRCEALFQLGRRQADDGQRVEAIQAFKDYLSKCPSHNEVADAKQILQGLETKGASKARRIGVLAPLTGSYAGFGKDVTEGVRLAVDKANQTLSADDQIELVVRDTGGDSVDAVKAARELIQQEGVMAILGPVTGSETAAVAALANQEKVPILCPAASRDGLSTLGPYVFRNSMTNEIQGRALARYAVEKMGLKQFAIVGPQDSYGEVLADSFRKQAESMGATITASTTYPPNATDFRQALTALGGRNPSLDKENDRENQRREQQLVYSLKREFLKALLPVTALGADGTTLAIAWAPFEEAYGSTLCPSVQGLIAQSASEGWAAAKNPVRNQDLVSQALTRLPEDSSGNTGTATSTATATVDPWGAVLDDLQANLLVTGSIMNKAKANPDDETWDYLVRLDSHFRAPDSTKVRNASVTLSLSEFKKSELLHQGVSFQALYLPAHTGEILSLASQLRFYGLKSQFLGGHCWENESVARDGGDTVEGAVFVSGFWVDSSKSNVKDFTAAYAGKYGRRPNLLAAQSYDAARLLARALQGSQNRDDVRSKLTGIQDFDGVSGETSFNGTGGAEKKVPILKIEHGHLKELD
jgi:ABC-type branched-subunit amino acid transport system substrate-binding protein